MKRTVRWCAMLMLGCVLFSTFAMSATTTALPSATQSEGLEAAKALTKITGVAISPLLGVGVVGAYDFFTCPKGKENTLPWFAQVKFWLPALLLVGACAAKETWGAVWPVGWKKPFDVAETVESKITALVVAGAVIPSIAAIFHSALTSDGGGTANVTHAAFLGMSLTPLLNILTIPLAVVVFVMVWMVGHVIDVLILISPWGQVDAALKAIRTSLMGLLAAVHFINPIYGVVLSLAIIVTAYCLSGWSFRLMTFGSVYAWDFFTFRRKRFQPASDANWMFTARKIEKTPIRTYGRLQRGMNGELIFNYRPWLFLAPRQLVLPAEGRYAIGRGLFYPEIMMVEGEKTRSMLVLPPRFKKHEEALSQIYGISEVRDVGLLKGLKAVWAWLKGSHGASESTERAVAAA